MTNYFVRRGDLGKGDVFVDAAGGVRTVVKPYEAGEMSTVPGAVPDVDTLDDYTIRAGEVETRADEMVLILHKRTPTAHKGS